MKRLILPCILYFFLLSACQTLYNPNLVQTPLFSDGGELQGALQIGSNGYGLKVAWSPVYHLGLMASGNMFSIIQDSVGEDKFRHLFGEAGIGGYTRLSTYWRLGFYAGYGLGSTGDLAYTGVYRRIFFQPHGGISSPFFDAAFAPRLSLVNNYLDRSQGSESQVERQGVFLEPQLMIRAGVEQLKFTLQGGYAFLMGGGPLETRSRKGMVGGFGIHLTFGKDFSRYGETRFRLPAGEN